MEGIRQRGADIDGRTTDNVQVAGRKNSRVVQRSSHRMDTEDRVVELDWHAWMSRGRQGKRNSSPSRRAENRGTYRDSLSGPLYSSL